MRIVKLQAQNIKNLRAVEISPDGNIVQIRGKNGAGKSAVLDAIYSGLSGAKLDDIVRHGQDRGFVSIDLGEFVVTRVYMGDDDRLEIRNPEGLKYPSPQTMLNKLLGKLTFDPLEFQEMKPAAQRELLMRMVGLNFSDLDLKYSQLYESRTGINRDIKRLEAQKGVWKDDPEIPDHEISLSEQVNKVRDLQNKRQKYLDACREHEDLELDRQEQINRMDQAIENYAQERVDVEQSIARLQVRLHEIDESVKRLDGQKRDKEDMKIPAVTVTEISQDQIDAEAGKIEEVEKINERVRQNRMMRDINKQLSDQESELGRVLGEIDKVSLEKRTRALSCKFPIDGLGVDEENVLLKDIPLQRLSTGQQIKISTAIAMALNPKLKVILIREGSLLDRDGLNTVISMAQERDYQVWIEKVGDESGVGVYIEDGEVKHAANRSV